MKELIKQILRTFFIANAGVTIGAAIFITLLQKDEKLGVEILWQIIAVSLMTSLFNVIMHSKSELTKRQVLIRMIIQYILINIVVLGSAYLFHWIRYGESIKLLSIIICIFCVYIFVWVINYKNDSKVAEMLNKKISEYNEGL